MGNPSGEHTDAFHLSGVEQFLLHLFVCRNVAKDHHYTLFLQHAWNRTVQGKRQIFDE
jgi:hypothetical protein